MLSMDSVKYKPANVNSYINIYNNINCHYNKGHSRDYNYTKLKIMLNYLAI